MSTDRVVTQNITEVSSKPTPAGELPTLQSEVLWRAVPGASAASLTPETIATVLLPPNVASSLLAESLAGPWPAMEAPIFLVEVLRRDTAASAIVTTRMDAFGDQPWPDAQRGVFAFRHDWTEPLLERLEWQTSVARLSSGNELRQARRRVPRRTLTYQVGNARQSDALVADWLVDHLGQTALWPLPHYAVHLSESCERGARAIHVSRVDWRQFGPISANLRLTYGAVVGWQEEQGNGRWVLIIACDGWQIAQLDHLENGAQSDLLWLAEPLARAQAMGSIVMPLVWGRAIESADLTQWVPGMGAVSVPVQIEPALWPDESVLDDPLLDDIPVWPDGNWREDPSVAVQATMTQQDFSPADPWVRRDDPWSSAILQRRYLASSSNEIEIWRARLWRTQGRLEAFWLPDGLAPILWVATQADPEDGFVRVHGQDNGTSISAFWHRPGACLIVHPDGARQYALSTTFHLDRGGVLVLRSGLQSQVPQGSRVIRLAFCRLDHDAIDLYWHSPTLMEITLRARQLPEPRGNNRATQGEYAV